MSAAREIHDGADRRPVEQQPRQVPARVRQSFNRAPVMATRLIVVLPAWDTQVVNNILGNLREGRRHPVVS